MLQLLAIIISSLITTTPSYAAGENCYSISNSDAKNFCLATARNDDGYCINIDSADKRNMCLAMVRRNKGYCYNIDGADQRNMCLAYF